MKKILVSTCAGFVLALVLVSSQFVTRESVAQQESVVFYNNSLRGVYVFHLTGSVFLPGAEGFNGPFARIGRMVADGQGHLNVSSAVANYNGFVFRESYPGTYSVNPDGTYTATINPGFPNADFTFDGILYDSGRKASMILSSVAGLPVPPLPPGLPVQPSAWVGTAISGELVRQ
jgi:hypothetical protein